MAKGGVLDAAKTLIPAASTSTSPVGRSLLTASRRRTTTADADDGLVAQVLGLFHQARIVRAEDDLGQALAVADVDEDEVAHVAGLVDPAAEDDLAALVGGAQGAGVMGALPGFGLLAHDFSQGSGLNIRHFRLCHQNQSITTASL